MKTHYTPATRILCMLLCLVMLLGMMPPMSARAEEDQSSEPQSTSVETAAEETTAEEPVEQVPVTQEESSLDAPAVNAAATEPAHTSIVWSKSELGTGYKYVPKVMANNSGFLNDYVFNSNKLNLNDRFTKISGKNAKGAGNSLPRGNVTGDKNDDWYASYRWTPTQAERDILAANNSTLYYQGKMIPNYHKHWYVFWTESHWSYSGIRLVRSDNDGNNTWTYHQNDYGYKRNGDSIESYIADKKNDGQAQAVSKSWDDYPAGNKSLIINLYDDWAVGCGKSSVNGNVFYMVVGGNEPYVSSAYLSGEAYQKLEADTTGTLTIKFSQDVRFADNNYHDDITVELAAEYLNQSKSTGGFSITAKLKSMTKNTMVFEFPIKKEWEHFMITGIKKENNGLMCQGGKQLDLKVYDADGNELKSHGRKTSSMLVNIYGDELSVGSIDLSNHCYDGVAPQLTKVDMTGADISTKSTQPPTNWLENSGNNRYVYAGVDDTMTFTVYFNENIDVEKQGDARAVLSIKDGKGKPVELAVEKIRDNYITFKKLKITADMQAAGERIVIEKFTNLTVTDWSGNVCATNLTSNIKKPDQQITLDVDSPVVSSSIPDSYLESTNPKVYRPYESALGKLYFSFPVTFADFNNNNAANSGISGMDVGFSLNMPSGAAYAYQWKMNNTQVLVDDGKWNNGTTGAANTFQDVSDGTQYWVHIKLDPNVNYDYTAPGSMDENGIYFIGTLDFSSAADWAGNPAGGNVSYTVKQQVDEEGPGGAMTAAISVTPDYENTTVNFATSFRVTDNFAIESVMYRWYTKMGNAADYTAGSWTTLEGSQLGGNMVTDFRYSPTFSYNYNQNRYGSVKLEVMVEDVAGNAIHTFVSEPASFNYTMPSSNSTVVVNDPNHPVKFPEIIVKTPKFEAGADFQNPPRTLVLIPLVDSVDENGNYTQFYAWDAWDWDTQENVYAADYKPFQAMQDALDALQSPMPTVMYRDLPGSFYKLTGSVDLQNNSGTFTDMEVYSRSTELQIISDYLNNYYGRLDIYMVTSSSFVQFTTSADGKPLILPEQGSSGNTPDNPADLSFISVESIIDSYTVYLANNPSYNLVTTKVVNAEGETDAEAERDMYYKGEGRPLLSLDNVAFTIQITNVSDATAANGQGYGLQFLNFSEGNQGIKLYYQGDVKDVFDGDMSAYTPIKTWDLVQTSDGIQTIVLEPGLCKENGWYIIVVDITDTNEGKTYTFNLSKQGEDPLTGEKFDYYCQFFMDQTVLDITAESIEKQFSETVGSDHFEWNLEDIQASYENGEVPTIGMAPMPEDWETTYSVIRFNTVPRPEGDPATTHSKQNAYIRVYNETYNGMMELESNPAVWNFVVQTYSTTETYSYYLADLENPEENPYGTEENLRLPMVPGRNLIVYEIQAANGVITTHEITIDVVTTTEDWSLEYELFPNEEVPTSVVIWPVDSTGASMDLNVTGYNDLTMDQTKYNFYRLKRWVSANGYFYNDDQFVDSYTYDRPVEDHEYAMIDPLGNVSVRTLSVLDGAGNVMMIDGTEPHYVGFTRGSDTYYTTDDYYNQGDTFYFQVYTYDHQSWMDARDATVTFDAKYSEYLHGSGILGEDGRLTMKLPLALDENGELLKNEDGTYAAWTSVDPNHNGIFYTRVLQEGPSPEDVEEYDFVGYVCIEVMGTWMANEELVGTERTLTFGFQDAYGNVAQGSETFNPSHHAYDFSIFALDKDYGYGELTNDGIVGLATTYPFAYVEGYGVGSPELFVDTWEGRRKFYYTAPMITQDSPIVGVDEDGDDIYEPYTFKVTDLFGNMYDIPVYVGLFGKLGIEVGFSETNPTNQPVTVYASATGNIEKIASIVASDGTVGTIDPLDPSKASITVNDNCLITITTDAEPASERVVRVSNIDKVLDPAYITYYDPYYNILDPQIGATSVTAVLCCDTENLLATNGMESYTFPAGSKAGDTYTFEYQDEAGNRGTITATLPCDLILPETIERDTTAPYAYVTMYALVKDQANLIDQFQNPGFDATAGESEITATLNDPNRGGARANSFRLILNVEEESDYKVLITPNGTAAPTDYATAQQGSTVEDVSLAVSRSGATINVSANVVFDIHVIDAEGNVTTMEKVRFNTIDGEAPELYPVYERSTDPETGLPVVIATFYPMETEKFAEIQVLTAGVPSREEILIDSDGNEVTVIRYYHIFKENGTFSFTYEDDLGNVGTATAEVKGLTIEAARVLSQNWYGTRSGSISNVPPTSSDMVNRNIIAQLRLNMAISNVELFVYDDEAADHIGDPVDETYPVSATFTGTNIDITYSGNVNTQIVVRYTASTSGRTGTYILPAISCIDKDMPQVTLTGTTVANNKQSGRYTFTTNEPALLSQAMGQGYQTSHTLIFTENKSVNLNFTDRAGNQVSYRLEVTGLDLVELEASYSISADGAGATTKPATELNLNVGSTLYVYVNKEATANLNGTNVGTFQAGAWNPMTIPGDPGVHILALTDTNTGDVVLEAVYAIPSDRIAPEIHLPTSTILVSASDTADQMNAAAREGVTVTDNKDSGLTFTVSGIPQTMDPGLYTLTYVATDTSGNQVSTQRYLYIMDENTPILYINDEVGTPYGKVFLKLGEVINLTLQMPEGSEEQPVTIKFRKGMLTTGQMKYYATTVEDMSFTVTETGHYTVYVRNQDRTEFVTYIYVEG